jgi:hypothetical protein
MTPTAEEAVVSSAPGREGVLALACQMPARETVNGHAS